MLKRQTDRLHAVRQRRDSAELVKRKLRHSGQVASDGKISAVKFGDSARVGDVLAMGFRLRSASVTGVSSATRKSSPDFPREAGD
jgi:hypothetical protein